MTYGNIARPYPETVEALEECICQRDYEIEALRLRIQGLQQTIEHQARQDGERIGRLTQINSDKMQEVAIGRDLVAAHVDRIQVLHNTNSRQAQEIAIAEERIADQAERIAALEVEVECGENEIKRLLVLLAQKFAEIERFRDERKERGKDMLAAADCMKKLEAEVERLKHTRSWMDGMIREFLAAQAPATGQHDLPPTRAEMDEIVRRVFRRDQCARPGTIECRMWECQVRNRCRYAEAEATEDLD